jgi:hypothetical protein
MFKLKEIKIYIPLEVQEVTSDRQSDCVKNAKKGILKIINFPTEFRLIRKAMRILSSDPNNIAIIH